MTDSGEVDVLIQEWKIVSQELHVAIVSELYFAFWKVL
jgi:hypothetical protein